jgi:hypothetical protein
MFFTPHFCFAFDIDSYKTGQFYDRKIENNFICEKLYDLNITSCYSNNNSTSSYKKIYLTYKNNIIISIDAEFDESLGYKLEDKINKHAKLNEGGITWSDEKDNILITCDENNDTDSCYLRISLKENINKSDKNYNDSNDLLIIGGVTYFYNFKDYKFKYAKMICKDVVKGLAYDCKIPADNPFTYINISFINNRPMEFYASYDYKNRKNVISHIAKIYKNYDVSVNRDEIIWTKGQSFFTLYGKNYNMNSNNDIGLLEVLDGRMVRDMVKSK